MCVTVMEKETCTDPVLVHETDRGSDRDTVVDIDGRLERLGELVRRRD